MMWPFSRPVNITTLHADATAEAATGTAFGTWRIIKDPHAESWTVERYGCEHGSIFANWWPRDRAFTSPQLAEAWIQREQLRPIVVKQVPPPSEPPASDGRKATKTDAADASGMTP